MKARKTWTDPIVDEVRRVREQLETEYQKDPQGFFEHARNTARKAGIVYSKAKPLPFPGPKKGKK